MRDLIDSSATSSAVVSREKRITSHSPSKCVCMCGWVAGWVSEWVDEIVGKWYKMTAHKICYCKISENILLSFGKNCTTDIEVTEQVRRLKPVLLNKIFKIMHTNNKHIIDNRTMKNIKTSSIENILAFAFLHLCTIKKYVTNLNIFFKMYINFR
jgi:aspartate/methionine/tyrosine aminotransferase